MADQIVAMEALDRIEAILLERKSDRGIDARLEDIDTIRAALTPDEARKQAMINANWEE